MNDDNKTEAIPMPDYLEFYTGDEVAECIGYWKHLTEAEGSALCTKLWNFVYEAKKRTPLGGDGSNGTVETPCGRLDSDNDDKAPHWWTKLTEREQKALIAADPERLYNETEAAEAAANDLRDS
jgi:hypothetical protein